MKALGTLIASVLCAASRALATDVEVMPLSKVASLSGHVCWGTIESTTAQWADGHHEIETVLHLVGVEFIKGEGPQSFDLVVPGGSLDGWTMRVQGAPEFEMGQRWMFFLLPEWRTHPCAGMWQGAYRAVDTPTGSTVLGGVVGGDRAVAGLDDHGLPRAPADGEVPMSVEQWTNLVREVCAADAAGAAARPGLDGAKEQGIAISTRVWPSHRATPMKDREGRAIGAPARTGQSGVRRNRTSPVPATPMPREEVRP